MWPQMQRRVAGPPFIEPVRANNSWLAGGERALGAIQQTAGQARLRRAVLVERDRPGAAEQFEFAKPAIECGGDAEVGGIETERAAATATDCRKAVACRRVGRVVHDKDWRDLPGDRAEAALEIRVGRIGDNDAGNWLRHDGTRRRSSA